jgi:hypothetical protein
MTCWVFAWQGTRTNVESVIHDCRSQS